MKLLFEITVLFASEVTKLDSVILLLFLFATTGQDSEVTYPKTLLKNRVPWMRNKPMAASWSKHVVEHNCSFQEAEPIEISIGCKKLFLSQSKKM